MARHEVGVEVSEEDVLDRVSSRGGVLQILPDVSLWIDHRRRLRDVVNDHVRRMGEAGEIVLLNLHHGSKQNS